MIYLLLGFIGGVIAIVVLGVLLICLDCWKTRI